jgi:cytochrome b
MRPPVVERHYVWDRFVRLHHWSLAALVLGNHFALEDRPHRWAGYTALGLVGLRLVWGFVGSTHARFSAFAPTPRRLRAHLAQPDVAARGHNPFGGAMVLVILTLVAALGFSGWLMGTDACWGEAWLEDIHESLADGLLACVALHVAGVIAASLKWRINLPRAMLTGYKTRTAHSAPFEDPRAAGND